jgi:UDP-glucose 4-epimerase
VQVYLKQNTYALSKSFAEEIIKYDVVKHQSAAMVFRISNIYGPNARSDYNSVIATFADRIKKNKQLEINGDGSQKRDYVYVDDVVNAIVKAIEAKPKSGIEYLDICSGEETSLRQIISLCEKILAKSLTVSYNKNRPSDNWNLKLNFGRTEKFLNWRAQVDMEEGLKRILLND